MREIHAGVFLNEIAAERGHFGSVVAVTVARDTNRVRRSLLDRHRAIWEHVACQKCEALLRAGGGQTVGDDVVDRRVKRQADVSARHFEIVGGIVSDAVVPIHYAVRSSVNSGFADIGRQFPAKGIEERSEEHTSELQSHSFISYAVFCLKKK